MEITKLISVYERLLPAYKKAYDENWSYWEMDFNYLSAGICYASHKILGIRICNLMERYYKNFLDSNGYLFQIPHTGKDLKSRIDFMESEIKTLKN